VRKRMARPVGKWFVMLARTVCTNVSGLSAIVIPRAIHANVWDALR